MKVVALSALKSAARTRQTGYLEEVMDRGSLAGDHVILSDEDFAWIASNFRPDFSLKNGAKIAGEFARAIGEFLAAGAPLVSAEVYALRTGEKGCATCPEFEPAFASGIGRCLACGCLAWKPWLATSECPLPDGKKRWSKST